MVALFLLNLTVSMPVQAAQDHAPRSEFSYTVRKGDILGYVSLRNYGSSKLWKRIARWNNLSNPDHISVGQKLVLKTPPSRINSDEGEKLVQEDRVRKKVKNPIVLYKKGNYRTAVDYFSTQRKAQPDKIAFWLYELSSAKLGGRRAEFESTSKLFIAKYPQLKDIGLLKPMDLDTPHNTQRRSGRGRSMAATSRSADPPPPPAEIW